MLPFVFLLALLEYALSTTPLDVPCPEPWPIRNRNVNGEYCTCQRDTAGLRMQCRDLSYWPDRAPDDLIDLKLDGCEMHSLEMKFLGRLAPNLRAFSCRLCGLQNISSFAFFGLNDIKTINLQGNRIQKLPPYAFSGIENVDMIDLRNTQLDTLEPKAFFGLRGVHTLDLSENPLSSIKIHAFRNLSGVEQLSLNRIGTKKLNGYTLQGLKNIRLLSFAHSNIERIESYAFYGIENISTINFHSSSDLREVEELAFIGVGKVDTIKFKATVISSLRCGVFEGLHCVRSIEWDTTPLRCDCNMEWMSSMRQNISRDWTQQMRCASPLLLSGRDPFELKASELGCTIEQRYMGCPKLDEVKPRVKALERYFEEVGLDAYASSADSLIASLSLVLLCLVM